MSQTVAYVFFLFGMVAFAVGASLWSGSYRQSWVEPFGLGMAAGGLVLIVAGLAMAPGWS